MIGRTPTISVTILVVLCMLTFFSCGGKNSVGTGEDTYSDLLKNVIFVPDSGPPGTPIRLVNLPHLPEDGLWSLSIGNISVPIIKSDSGYYTSIPLLFSEADSTWPTASISPLDVILYLDSIGVDTAFGKITVDSLTHANGAVDSLIQDFLDAAIAIRDISQSLGIEDTLLQAVCMAMDEIILTGDNSLYAIIHGTSPTVGNDALPEDLFSAMLVSSGTSELISRWSDSLQAIQQSASTYRRNKSMVLSSIDDEGLAYRMQMYSLLSDFSSIAVGQTALTWNQVSAVLGGAGIAFPPLGTVEFIVSFVVAELDFLFNKIALALLPSEITSFDLDFRNHQLKTGDTTEAVVYISARNNPPNITPLDIVTQIVNGMGLAEWIHGLGGPRRLLASNFNEVILNITTWFIGVVNNVLGTYFNAPTMLDVSLPSIMYDSVLVQNPQLIDLLSPDYSKIEPMSESFNGKAKDSTGNVTLMMATQSPGPNTLVHPVLVAAGYAGGAFGNDYYTSKPDTIKIVADLVLDISLPSPIDPEGAVVLHIQAGIRQSDSTITYKSGIDITVSITGGTAEETSGVTDTNGIFTTVVHPNTRADYVVAEVTASDQSGATESKTVTAEVQGTCRIVEFIHDVLITGNMYYSLELICDEPPQRCEFQATWLPHEYWPPSLLFDWWVDGVSLQEESGTPQGYHGVLYIEFFARACWTEGPCAQKCKLITDTVSVVIP